jgi:RNA polymerase sigma-54 factor
MLRQQLKQKMLQKLLPQQIQVIRLLEIPVVQLEEKIKKELEDNPVLEEGPEDYSDEAMKIETNEENDEIVEDVDIKEKDEITRDENEEFDVEDYIQDEDIPYYKLSASNYDSDYKKEEISVSAQTSLYDFLEQQLHEKWLSEKEVAIGLYLIGTIDEDGYIRRDIFSISNDLAFNEDVEADEKEIEKVLVILQEFDPAGIGARDIQECLLIQLKRKDIHLPEIKMAKQIIENHFDLFSKKHYNEIAQIMSISQEELKSAIDEILKLNPKPGSSYADPTGKDEQQVIIPDFNLEMRDGELYLSLNSRNIPELRLNSEYLNMLNRKTKDKSEKEAIQFIKQKSIAAKNFIDALQQRQITMLAVMNAIIVYQEKYFKSGDERDLKPMILNTIADTSGYDISTVSRVINSKYIQTNFGIFSLKYFFSEGIQTTSGDEVSSREIKMIIQECIEAENKRKPMTDEQLAKILNEKGYNIARRTVAKYREMINIPVARLRKELK